MKIAVFCVGNKLALDDGIGCFAYEELTEHYEFSDNIDLFDVGCLSMDMLTYVNEYDVIISVDAVDETGLEPGTVFRYTPDDIAHRGQPMTSLHDLKLADLLDAAKLLDYTRARGVCFGMQGYNMNPPQAIIGLTPACDANMDLLVDSVLAELANLGCPAIYKDGPLAGQKVTAESKQALSEIK